MVQFGPAIAIREARGEAVEVGRSFDHVGDTDKRIRVGGSQIKLHKPEDGLATHSSYQH